MTAAADELIDNGIQRDRWDRPLIKPAKGNSKPKAYRRVTTFIKVLEDRYNLEQWGKRQVAYGIGQRQDLFMAAHAANADDKKTLDGIAKQAMDAAASSAKANVGTAVHKLCEKLDLNQLPDINAVPVEYRGDVLAYQAATAEMQHQYVEQMRVLDLWGGVAGTPDRISFFRDDVYVTDIKTGNVEWGQLAMAMQLAIYSHAKRYNHITGERLDDVPMVNKTKGIIIHLPAGTGQCTLHWIDLQRGWGACQAAAKVWDWRAESGLMTPVESVAKNRHEWFADHGMTFEVAATKAPTVDDLRELWVRADQQCALTPAFRAAVDQRRKELGA